VESNGAHRELDEVQDRIGGFVPSLPGLKCREDSVALADRTV